MFKYLIKVFIVLIVFSVAFPAAAYLPSDPMYSQQSYLKQISIERAWDYAKGDGMVVAVIDSGVDIDHPDLSFNIWKNVNEIPNDGIDNDHNGYIDDVNGWDFIENNNDPRPKLTKNYDENAINHGTAIAGLIAAVANNDKGITGVAFNGKIMPLKILDASGSGDVETLIKAIDYAVANGADVINLSLVGYDYSETLAKAIRRAYEQGVTVVAAAGNTNAAIKGIDLDFTSAYPACYGDKSNNNWVAAIASVNSSDIKSTFSNFGLSCIDIAAPGEDITSLAYYYPANENFRNYYSYNWSGTSFSTALVSGAAALLKSKEKFLKPAQVISTLSLYADNINGKNPLYQNELGGGRLNAGKALAVDFSDLKVGRLVKLKNQSAVYYVNYTGTRHLFVNEPTYWSWYNGIWREQKIETISQEEFDSLPVGFNVTIRPGNLIKFENSPRVYAVSPGVIIHYASEEVANKLYSESYQKKVVTIQDGFESDYSRGEKLVDYKYPDGSLIQYAGTNDIFYIQDGKKRLTEPAGFLANKLKETNIIKNVSQDIFYNTGKPITDFESDILIYNI